MLWTVTHQAPLSMRFPRQEYWSGLPSPSPGDFSSLKERTGISCIGRPILYLWATREALDLLCDLFTVSTSNKEINSWIDAFELWCWRRLLRVPWAVRRSNWSTLKDISPRCSLEGLMLKLKLQYFGHPTWRVDSLEKTLMLGGIEGRRRRGWQRMRWLDGITNSMDMSSGNSRNWWWAGRPGVLQFMGSQRVGHNWATELNGTETLLYLLSDK